MSRTALLDLVLMFFALGGFGAPARRPGPRAASCSPRQVGALRQAGAGRGSAPLRTALARLAAVAAGCRPVLGLAAGTKWTGLFFLAASA